MAQNYPLQVTGCWAKFLGMYSYKPINQMNQLKNDLFGILLAPSGRKFAFICPLGPKLKY